MCGIFGGYSFRAQDFDSAVLEEMAGSIWHRGPDARGVWNNERAAVGNCRLSIIDLSERSDQPLFSEDGQIVLVQNGEIYNFLELRESLLREGARFSTSGDTEVLLRAYETWGPGFVTRLNGMFAIAVYDGRDEGGTLRLYRDRLGVKPLYLSGDPESGRLWFGSEIKALLATGIERSPDLDAIAQYLALNYIPPDQTAFEGIRHLPPAHWAEITPAGIRLTRYWDLSAVAVERDMSEAEAKSGLLALLDDATRIRMRADAPFGAFLSGGLDSSSVVGFMSMYQTDPVRTFSIGFDDPRFDESDHARAAARRFGTLHERRVTEYEAAELWPKFIWHVDQPHGDVSFIPMYQVSALASRDVKMVLTGDGGDELFAGYEKYARFFASGTADLPEGWQDDFARQSGLLLDDEPEQLLSGELAAAFRETNPYRALLKEMQRAPGGDPINQVLHAETAILLPGNNLVKPDRMAMANSLEVRSPFLDYRMAEFAFSVPGAMKLQGQETKAIYKLAVRDLLGDALTWRKKQMFTVPIGEWFRQSLAGYCRELLLDGRLESRGLVESRKLSEMLEAHIHGTHNYTRQIRALISLEIWFRLFIDQDPVWLEKAAAPYRSFG